MMVGVMCRINFALAAALTRSSSAFVKPSVRAYSLSSPLYSTPPSRFLLTYEYIPDVLEKRGPYR